MEEEIIKRESYIVSRNRLDETYFGRNLDTGEEPIASHLIIVPANKIVPLKVKVRKSSIPGKKVEDVSTFQYISKGLFTHQPDFQKYKTQLLKKFDGLPPFAVISHNSVLAFMEKDTSFEILKAPYDFIINSWCFNEELGNGRHFLQLAYVDTLKNFDNVSLEVFFNFFDNDPLGTLVGRTFPRIAHQRQDFPIEKEFY